MITLHFESHATSLDNEAGLASGHFDLALSATGERQARELGERYGYTGLDAVFCSDLQRSYKTAVIAFEDRGIPIERDERLRECDYGTKTRRPRSEVLNQLSERLETPFPGGESYRQAAARVKEFLRDVAHSRDGQTVLVVGHRATQFGLEHWLNRKPLEGLIRARWRWQPGWTYSLDPLSEAWR